RKDKDAARAAQDGEKKKEKEDPEPVRNITDPGSRLMHCTLRGTVQAYNCQVPRTADGVFLLPRATAAPTAQHQPQAAPPATTAPPPPEPALPAPKQRPAPPRSPRRRPANAQAGLLPACTPPNPPLPPRPPPPAYPPRPPPPARPPPAPRAPPCPHKPRNQEN